MMGSSTLVVTALLLGIGGIPHCAAMCGATSAACTAAPAGTAPWRTVLPFHAMRLLSYGAAGAALAWATGTLPALTQAVPMLRPFWTLLHAGVLALGLWLLFSGRLPLWLGRIGAAPARAMGIVQAQPVRLWRRRPVWRAALTGSLWAGWPCGLLQAAFLTAALASSPGEGSAVMVAFAVASAPGLWLGPWLWQRFGPAGVQSLGGVATRLAGLGLAAGAGFALWHGLWTEAGSLC